VLLDPGKLNIALSLTAIVTVPVAAIILMLGLKPFRASVAMARGWS